MSKNKLLDKISILYFKSTDNSVIKPRSSGGLGPNLKDRKGYILTALTLIILFIITSTIYLTH